MSPKSHQYNLVSILCGDAETFTISDTTVSSDDRLTHILNQYKLTWDPIDVVNDSYSGHIDAYSVTDNVITLVGVLKGEYRCCPRSMSLALAHEIVREMSSPGYIVSSYLLCFDALNVRRVPLSPMLFFEAKKYVTTKEVTR